MLESSFEFDFRGLCMDKFFRVFEPFYLLMLGIGVGGIVACGAFAAPVVFNMKDIVAGTSVLDSGVVMSMIFMRLNGFLQGLLALIAVYEIASFIFLRRSDRYSILWLILGVLSVIFISLFVWYYTPFIANIENLASENFKSMHEQSVVVFKALMASLSVLFIFRIYIKMK